MSSLATSSTAVPSSKDDWITPQEQLHQLALVAAKDRLYANKAKFETLRDTIAYKEVTKCAIKSILKHSNLLQPTDEIPSLFDQCVERLIEPAPLPSCLTNWYTARKKLDNLPEKIPPLPRNIHQILNGKCPIYGDQTKFDGTYHKVSDTHVLQLLCEEDGNLDQFEEVVKHYGEEHYPANENSLQFRFFWDAARQEYGSAQFEPSHWDLSTKTVLPGSRKQPYSTQVGMVNSLSQKAFVHYEIPSVKNISRTVFLHKVATEESLYTAGNEHNGNLSTCSRLEELTQDWRLLFGGSTPSGPRVTDDFGYGVEFVGIGARRKFRPSDIGNLAMASGH